MEGVNGWVSRVAFHNHSPSFNSPSTPEGHEGKPFHANLCVDARENKGLAPGRESQGPRVGGQPVLALATLLHLYYEHRGSHSPPSKAKTKINLQWRCT